MITHIGAVARDSIAFGTAAVAVQPQQTGLDVGTIALLTAVFAAVRAISEAIVIGVKFWRERGK